MRNCTFPRPAKFTCFLRLGRKFSNLRPPENKNANFRLSRCYKEWPKLIILTHNLGKEREERKEI